MLDNHLATFITVADSGSFLAASEKLFISGNAVAKQVNLLENDLNIKLFARSTQGLKLTPAGKLIYDEAKKMTRHVNQVLAKARELQEKQESVLRVGVSLMNPVNLFLNRFNRIAPGHDMRLEIVPYEDTPTSFGAMLDGLGSKVDFICCTYDNTFWGDRFNVWKMVDLPVRLTMSRSHSLAAKGVLTPNELIGQTIRLRRRNLSASNDPLHDFLMGVPGIRLKEYDYVEYGDFNALSASDELMTSFDTWSAVHPLLATLPVEWDFTSPYGLIYAKRPGEDMTKLLELLDAANQSNGSDDPN